MCDDVSAGELDRIAQIACRGVYQNMGQNCAGPERFFVAEANGVYDKLCARITAIVSKMRTGAPLNDAKVDCGAITMGARQIAHYQALVDDAVSGARACSTAASSPRATTSPRDAPFYASIAACVPRQTEAEAAPSRRRRSSGPSCASSSAQGHGLARGERRRGGAAEAQL